MKRRTYCEVGELGAVELRDAVEAGANTEHQLELEERARPVGRPTEAPDLENRLQVEHHREAQLEEKSKPNLKSEDSKIVWGNFEQSEKQLQQIWGGGSRAV